MSIKTFKKWSFLHAKKKKKKACMMEAVLVRRWQFELVFILSDYKKIDLIKI